MLHSGRQRYVAQCNVNKARPLLWFQKIKTHVQTACEFPDLNMGFVVWTWLLAYLSIASNSYVHRSLCKNNIQIYKQKNEQKNPNHISCHTSTIITKTCLYNFDPLKPHFYIVKPGFTGVYIILLISAQKHRLWVLVRTASARRF